MVSRKPERCGTAELRGIWQSARTIFAGCHDDGFRTPMIVPATNVVVRMMARASELPRDGFRAAAAELHAF